MCQVWSCFTKITLSQSNIVYAKYGVASQRSQYRDTTNILAVEQQCNTCRLGFRNTLDLVQYGASLRITGANACQLMDRFQKCFAQMCRERLQYLLDPPCNHGGSKLDSKGQGTKICLVHLKAKSKEI